MEKQKQKYIETVEKELFSKDYFKNDYPLNRVKVELINYSWEYQDKNKDLVPYSWKKIKITNSKLQLQDNNIIIKQKIKWTYIVNDETIVKLTIEEFDDIIKSISKEEFDNTIKNISKNEIFAVKKSTPKKEEDINIEDIPF